MLGDVALPDGWKLAAVQTLVREDWRVVCPACSLPAGSTKNMWWKGDTLFVEYADGHVWMYEGAKVVDYKVTHSEAEGIVKMDVIFTVEGSIDNIKVDIDQDKTEQ